MSSLLIRILGLVNCNITHYLLSSLLIRIVECVTCNITH
nr:MAG TPA: hypothetical protein [Caudoviricetes sp.]